ncbi:MAG: hypothetical protein C4518_08580 [Desulfobacteraceae bacterium]|nr:MAG: hypothetical protein C4518_08580 [Desulfobacteraceae bacterium]
MPDFDSGKPTGLKQTAFSDQHPSPFVDAINTDLKQTGVFIDRFFYRMSFKDLAVKYELSKVGASTLYRKAQARILELIGAEKRRKLASANCEQIVTMPKSIQCFLLYSVFGLTCPEVSSILNVGQSYVHRVIKKIRDQIMCGEVTMIEFAQSDREAARDRLEKFKEKKKKQDKTYHEKKQRKARNGAKP